MTPFQRRSLTLMMMLAVALAACDGSTDGRADSPPPKGAKGTPAQSIDDDARGDHGHVADVTTIPAETAQRSGIVVERVGPGTIRQSVRLLGAVVARQGDIARVSARYPGTLRHVDVQVGDVVHAGQRLATVESNASLSNYTITAPIAGVVTRRDADMGSFASEAPLFEIADLSRLWVDLHVFGRSAEQVRIGAEAQVQRIADGVTTSAVIRQILPIADVDSQSVTVRAELHNADGLWRPGMAVRADVGFAMTQVALRVPLGALQRMDGRDVVFVRDGDSYTATPVTLGLRDSGFAEVQAGLSPDDEVVVEQSFLIKADIGKAGVEHDD